MACIGQLLSSLHGLQNLLEDLVNDSAACVILLSTSFISWTDIHIPPPPLQQKVKLVNSSMFVKKTKCLYLAIPTTHFENQCVSGSASSDHLFINSLFFKIR